MPKHLNFQLLATMLMCCGSMSVCTATDETAAKAAFQFLEEPTTPRLIAMGNAGTAQGAAGFPYYNPAQPFFSNEPSLAIGFAPMPGDLNALFAEGVWFFPSLFAGFHLSNYTVSDIYPTADNSEPNYNVPFSAGFTLVSCDAGYTTPRFSIALAVSGMQDRLATSTAYGLSISVGAAYRAIPDKLSVGMSLLNEGTTTGYDDEANKLGDGEAMPRSGRLGIAFSDTVKRIPFHIAADVVYRDVGNKVHSARELKPRLTVPIGAEAWLTDFVALRLGKRFNFETEIVNFGVGLRFLPISFDMSFVITKFVRDFEVKPFFGLTIVSSPVGRKGPIKAPPVEIKPLAPPPGSPESETPVEETIIPSPAAPPPAAAPPAEVKPPSPAVSPAPRDTMNNVQKPLDLEKSPADTSSAPGAHP